MTPFVCSLISYDSGRTPAKIIAHKEAERQTGAGQFWWGLRTRLGPKVESLALLNQNVLPLFFLETGQQDKNGRQRIRVWSKWRSVNSGRSGNIPDHALVLSDDGDPKSKRRDEYYALVCHSDSQLALGNQGVLDLAQCRTTNNESLKFLRGAALLLSPTPSPLHEARPLAPQAIASQNIKNVALAVRLIAPWYVRVTNDRVLTESELDRLHQYKEGDDWLALVRSIRR
jgi:hypothetical protein